MNHDDPILSVILDAVREINSQEGEPRLVPARETILIGPGAGVDSVALVVFASTVEEHLERTLGRTVSVLDIFGSAGGGTLDIGGLASRIARKAVA
jgi:hypothetical protein